jgi:hypothetical protein
MAAGIELELAQAAINVQAATLFFNARLSEFEAKALTEPYEALESERLFAVGAAEALIDRKYDQAVVVLKSWGIDPSTRH